MAHRWSISIARLIHSTPCNPILSRSISLLSSYLCLCLPTGPFPGVLPIRIVYHNTRNMIIDMRTLTFGSSNLRQKGNWKEGKMAFPLNNLTFIFLWRKMRNSLTSTLPHPLYLQSSKGSVTQMYWKIEERLDPLLTTLFHSTK
jgi:hypothetical protein